MCPLLLLFTESVLQIVLLRQVRDNRMNGKSALYTNVNIVEKFSLHVVNIFVVFVNIKKTKFRQQRNRTCANLLDLTLFDELCHKYTSC